MCDAIHKFDMLNDHRMSTDMFIFKKKKKSYPYLGLIPAKCEPKISKLSKFANWLEAWHITRLMNSFSSFALLITLVVLWLEIGDRQINRTNQAWATVIAKAPGNSGKKEALEYLNSTTWLLKQKTSLVGIDLNTRDGHGAYLENIELPKAMLNYSVLSKANLRNANLTGAHLGKANLIHSMLYGAQLNKALLMRATLNYSTLSNADLSESNLFEAVLINADLASANLTNTRFERANLSKASLVSARLVSTNFKNANLSGAIFWDSNLDGVNLDGANLDTTDFSRANLLNAKNLTQEQLKQACGDENTILPPKFTIEKCKRYNN